MDTRWSVVALLVDPVRRALFEYVRKQPHAVTREEAADAAGTSRTLAAFHLDKLVEAGLLAARYEAPPGRPRGRGRAPKVYQATPGGLTLTVPPRRYELVGAILADAVAEHPTDARAAATESAAAAGQAYGRACQARPPSGASGAGGLSNPAVAGELASVYAAATDLGFEPRVAGGTLTLTNCPFHALAERQRDLVCHLNEAFVTGLLDGLDATDLRARLAPDPPHCCVAVAPAGG
jgi:predicted ArsR family transcriptional regulator